MNEQLNWAWVSYGDVAFCRRYGVFFDENVIGFILNPVQDFGCEGEA